MYWLLYILYDFVDLSNAHPTRTRVHPRIIGDRGGIAVSHHWVRRDRDTPSYAVAELHRWG